MKLRKLLALGGVLVASSALALTNFPGALDVTGTFGTAVHGQPVAKETINNLRDALIAVETKVGATGSLVTSSLTYILTNSASIDPGHQHTGASLSALNASTITAGTLSFARMPSPVYVRTSLSTVTNTAALTAVSTKTLEFTPEAGQVFTFRSGGTIKNDAVDTSQYRIQIGGTTVCDTGTFTAPTFLTEYFTDVILTLWIAGGSGTVQCDGVYHIGDDTIGVAGTIHFHASTSGIVLTGTPVIRSTIIFAGANAPTSADEVNEATAIVQVTGATITTTTTSTSTSTSSTTSTSTSSTTTTSLIPTTTTTSTSTTTT